MTALYYDPSFTLEEMSLTKMEYEWKCEKWREGEEEEKEILRV